MSRAASYTLGVVVVGVWVVVVGSGVVVRRKASQSIKASPHSNSLRDDDDDDPRLANQLRFLSERSRNAPSSISAPTST